MPTAPVRTKSNPSLPPPPKTPGGNNKATTTSTSNVVVSVANVGSNVQIVPATTTATATAKPTVAVEELTALVQATSLEKWIPTTPPYGDDDVWHE
jgi:hypothetical protein